jgi:hypothetical protein
VKNNFDTFAAISFLASAASNVFASKSIAPVPTARAICTMLPRSFNASPAQKRLIYGVHSIYANPRFTKQPQKHLVGWELLKQHPRMKWNCQPITLADLYAAVYQNW